VRWKTAAPAPQSSSTTSTTNVPAQSSGPPGRGSSGGRWFSLASDSPGSGHSHQELSGWRSEPASCLCGRNDILGVPRPKNQDWYYVEALAPSSDLSAPNGAGFAENSDGAWTIVSALSDRAPGCFGPEYQELPAGTADIPLDIASDFNVQC
jgi:hypothetical protein